MTPHLLPLTVLSGPHGSRSFMTCKYRCGNACDHPEPNVSGNQHIGEVLRAAITRRTVLGGAATASAAFVLDPLMSPAVAATDSNRAVEDLTYQPVPPNRRDIVWVPEGYQAEPLMRWGDKVLPDAPDFNPYTQSARAQAAQFGYNCDYVGLLPIDGSDDHATLVVNHEYTNNELMFPVDRYTHREQLRIEMAAHGMSVVEITRGRQPGSWRRVALRRAKRNRRITAHTPFRLTGPAAGHEMLRTSADPRGRTVLGTVNNCAGGTTPWGTVLSGEENFNSYFDVPEGRSTDPAYAESYARYGVGQPGQESRGWSEVDRRFDLSREPNEPFRFGWIIEIDPSDPKSTPRKRTMLGRLKHEGANITISKGGHAVAYMGDDERGDYVYKFVSRLRYRSGTGEAARKHNLTLLDDGTLYVARFNGDGTEDGQYDGTGQWLKLCNATRSFVEGMSVAEVLINTRLAADKLSPTRMDRPEDIQPNPVNGRIYCALTNNSRRGSTFPTDEANPLASSMTRDELGGPLETSSGNRNGYVLEITENGTNHAGTEFRWLLFLVCGDPEAPETYFGGYPKDRVSPISCPDNVEFDSAGNLWISTDGNALGSHDGLFSVPTTGANRGQVLQFLTVPVGAECSGPLITDDGRTVFVAVQHPGEADGSTFEDPASTWPHDNRFPRPSVVQTYRIDRGRIGR